MNKYLDCLVEKIQAVECNIDGITVTYDVFVDKMLEVLVEIRKNNRKIFFVGNGGSAGISMHMTTDYLKNGCICTHSMHDPSTLTCLANDYGYENVFSKQVEMCADAGDCLFAISSSGMSDNILRAVCVAKERNCLVVTCSGFERINQLRSMGNYNIYVPCSAYGIVESIHQLILQQIVDELKDRLEDIA
jgi:D-sedoheptulose 7-phosphate isomerase